MKENNLANILNPYEPHPDSKEALIREKLQADADDKDYQRRLAEGELDICSNFRQLVRDQELNLNTDFVASFRNWVEEREQEAREVLDEL